MLLKNNVRRSSPAVPPAVIELIQNNVLQLLNADARLLRSAAGMLTAAVAARFSLEAWPGLIEQLLQLVAEAAVPATQEVSGGWSVERRQG